MSNRISIQAQITLGLTSSWRKHACRRSVEVKGSVCGIERRVQRLPVTGALAETRDDAKSESERAREEVETRVGHEGR